MRKLKFFPILLLPICLVSSLFSQSVPYDSTTTVFQLLQLENITTITIEANFDSLIQSRKLNEEHNAKISLPIVKDSLHELKVKIRPRGMFRRKYCEIPPLRLNFNKKDLKRLGLNGDFDKYKLVTHCINDVEGEQVLLREYWTYRMYNEITPKSFQVHLIKIKYINTNAPDNSEERIGFLIENNDELADRLGGESVEPYGLKPVDVNRTTHQNITVFNYMIGNLDWKLAHKKNLKFFQHPEEGMLVVPYDFDMSAMVWPSYARLNPDYEQEKFEDRFCLGKFESKESLNQTLETFRLVKERCKEHIKSCEFLNSISKRAMLSYLSSFYYVLDKEKRIKKAFYSSIE